MGTSLWDSPSQAVLLIICYRDECKQQENGPFLILSGILFHVILSVKTHAWIFIFPKDRGENCVRERGIAQAAKCAAFLLQDYLSHLPPVQCSVIYQKIFETDAAASMRERWMENGAPGAGWALLDKHLLGLMVYCAPDRLPTCLLLSSLLTCRFLCITDKREGGAAWMGRGQVQIAREQPLFCLVPLKKPNCAPQIINFNKWATTQVSREKEPIKEYLDAVNIWRSVAVLEIFADTATLAKNLLSQAVAWAGRKCWWFSELIAGLVCSWAGRRYLPVHWLNFTLKSLSNNKNKLQDVTAKTHLCTCWLCFQKELILAIIPFFPAVP